MKLVIDFYRACVAWNKTFVLILRARVSFLEYNGVSKQRGGKRHGSTHLHCH